MKRVRKNFNDINWNQIQQDNNFGLNKKDLIIKYKLSYSTIKKAEILNIIKLVKHQESEEKKTNRIEKIKKWYKDNPEKHPWKNSSKKSVPCEKFKKILIFPIVFKKELILNNVWCGQCSYFGCGGCWS